MNRRAFGRRGLKRSCENKKDEDREEMGGGAQRGKREGERRKKRVRDSNKNEKDQSKFVEERSIFL